MLGILAISLIVFAILAGILAREAILTRKAKRLKEDYEAKSAKYREYKDGFGMLHLLNLDTDIVENLSVNPTSHHNGTWQEPPKTAMMAWFALVSRDKQINQQVVQQLPAQAESQLDLLTIFTQPTQSYAIIAGQQVGKTFQARRIAQYWLSTGCKPIVIGPKWDKGEWEGCTLFGSEYNLSQVSRGMQIIKRLAEDRHSNKNLSHKQHTIQPVFFDDWTAIAAELPEAEEFILKATTLFASVNIILYFMIHLDTANAWGVHKIGAALKNNFVKLLVYPGYNEAGLIDRSRNRGYIIRPGETIKDKKQVSLFSGTGSQLLLPDLVIQPPDDETRRIIEMVDSGISYKDISESIWGVGKYGKFYNDKIDRILSKYTPRIS